jgi:predicted nucleic-acid-binding Zn-ribbon protein
MKRGTISFRKHDNYCIPSNSDLLIQCKKLSYREIYSNQTFSLLYVFIIKCQHNTQWKQKCILQLYWWRYSHALLWWYIFWSCHRFSFELNINYSYDNYCIPSNSDLLIQCKKLSYREIYSNQNKLRRLPDLTFCCI